MDAETFELASEIQAKLENLARNIAQEEGFVIGSLNDDHQEYYGA